MNESGNDFTIALADDGHLKATIAGYANDEDMYYRVDLGDPAAAMHSFLQRVECVRERNPDINQRQVNALALNRWWQELQREGRAR